MWFLYGLFILAAIAGLLIDHYKKNIIEFFKSAHKDFKENFFDVMFYRDPSREPPTRETIQSIKETIRKVQENRIKPPPPPFPPFPKFPDFPKFDTAAFMNNQYKSKKTTKTTTTGLTDLQKAHEDHRKQFHKHVATLAGVKSVNVKVDHNTNTVSVRWTEDDGSRKAMKYGIDAHALDGHPTMAESVAARIKSQRNKIDSIKVNPYGT